MKNIFRNRHFSSTIIDVLNRGYDVRYIAKNGKKYALSIDEETGKYQYVRKQKELVEGGSEHLLKGDYIIGDSIGLCVSI